MSAIPLPRHYIKLLPSLEEHALQIAPSVEDWREAVFDDITERGTKVVIEVLPNNDHGERVGLCGDKYYCEACRTRDREDSIFIFKIDNADRRRPKTVPRQYLGQFILLTLRVALAPLDSVRDIFTANQSTDAQFESLVQPTLFESALSEQLLRVLAQAPRDLREEWRPTSSGSESDVTNNFIEIVRKLWLRFQLSKSGKLTPKQESLIRNLVPRAYIGPKERRQVLEVFNIALLNGFVRLNHPKPENVYDLLRALAPLPLAQALRSAIWEGMLSGLDKDALLRELYDIATHFTDLKLKPKEIEAWGDRVVSALVRAATETHDPLLEQLAEDCGEQTDPLGFVSAWALKNLQFEDIRAKTVLPAPSQDSGDGSPLSTEETVLRRPPVSSFLPNAETQISVLDAMSESAPGRSMEFEQWVLALQAIDADQTAAVILEVREKLSWILQLATNCRRLTDWSRLTAALSELKSELHDWTTRLPDLVRLNNDYAEAVSTYDNAHALIGSELDTLLTSGRFTPNDLREITQLLGQNEFLDALPNWVWRDDSDELATKDAQHNAKRLIEPQVRDRVKSILTCFEETGRRDLALLSLIPSPPRTEENIEPPAAALELYVRSWFAGTQELLQELPDGLLARLRSKDKTPHLSSKLRQAAGLCRKIRNRVSKSVIESIVDSLVGADDEQVSVRLADLYIEAIDFCEKYFGSAIETNFAQLEGWVAKQFKQPSLARQSVGTYGSEIWIEHNWIDARGARVPLVFSPSLDRPYGYVAAPLVLFSRQKRSYALRLDYDVRGRREAWPRDWENPSPTELLINEADWRDDPDQPDQYLYTFKVRIPIRREGRGERFEFQMNVTNAETSKPTSKAVIFSWDIIHETRREGIVLTWPENIDPPNVEKHPIGPQRKSGEILARLNQNGSFCVVAPRRFGKSTLVEFLRKKAEDSGFVVPPAIVCTNYYATGHGLDYEKVWQTLSDDLQSAVGSSITRAGSAEIPDENAFDHVRRAARKQSKKGILILFDEAQLFFPVKAGLLLGDIIKDRLERYWSVSRDDMAPVIFGFVGLSTLETQAGVNLSGLLRPLEVDELEETELNTLILSVTSNALNTTREARRRLARTAANIYILRTLVNRLAEHVQNDGRAWANYDDVLRVERVLRASLRDGREKQVSGYIRDILNDAEIVTDWKPSSAMPLAIALADAHTNSTAAHRLYEEARDRLNAWYDVLAENDASKLSYDNQQFKDHLRILEERGIIRNREFTSYLLQDWLVGFPKQIDDQEWKELLRRAAIKRIKIPPSLQKVSDVEGSEANVFTWTHDHEKFAYRITQLRTDDDKVRFSETREVLEKLKNRTKEGTLGSQFIFRLEDIGLSAQNESEAVQVYRWVEGIDLSRRSALPAAYVTDIGISLAQALQFLHSLNVVHRDLSPRNIVIAEEGGDPVIIDFGFARRLTPDVKTTIDSDYSAPEVRRTNPKWTKAADIFSLGATLSRVLDTKESCDCLSRVLAVCQHEEPEKRPDATTLITLFDLASKELHVAARKKDTWEKVKRASGVDYQNITWYGGLVEKFRGNFIGVALGCLPDQFDRCREAANFLNQVLEAWSSKRSEQLSLGKVKEDNVATGKILATEPVRLMHSIRRYHSHGEYEGAGHSGNKFRQAGEKGMVAMTLEAARQIGSYLGVNSLKEVVGCLVNSS